MKRLNLKYVRASENAQKQDVGIVSESKPDVRKVESDDDDSDFECYDKWDDKLVLVDVDREITGSRKEDPTLALLRNGSEENNNQDAG